MHKTFKPVLWAMLFFTMQACSQHLSEEKSKNVSTDLSFYKPGAVVNFKRDGAEKKVEVRYFHLEKLIKKETITSDSWAWNPPVQDFKGYMIGLYNPETGQPIAATAVDVSSSWTKFPRYGFLSIFDETNAEKRKYTIENLKNHHINGLQFYDWHYQHHQPLAGTVENPAEEWKDIAQRKILKKTVDDYINLAHQYQMNAMFYNLNYGILDGYDKSKLGPNVFIYKDKQHNIIDKYDLSDPFVSDIYFTDPANKVWQNHLIEENNKVYAVYNFDGFHIDQVGDRDKVYRYDGSDADLPNAFPKFIESMKKARPDKKLLFNAVNQYGQKEMAKTDLEFLYSEVWEPNDGFKDLAKVVTDNYEFSGEKKNSVIAAYMDYEKAEKKGFFNTPGVLLTDAVILAFGGNHLELGEHMLAKEYFPNNNLKMRPELSESLQNYYNFQVGYENLLRDGGSFTSLSVSSEQKDVKVNNWPPKQGEISSVSKLVGNKTVLHLINFISANSLEWRDKNGTQAEPKMLTDVEIKLENLTQPVKKIWYASPDDRFGLPVDLKFSQKNGSISFKIPQLKYWDMIVLE